MSESRASEAPSERSRGLTDLLVELSVALHKHAMYPEGHPSLQPSIDSVVSRADRLFGIDDRLSFGVARRQLIIEGVATDPNHPVIRRLAEGLHRHLLGAVSLLRGLRPEEVAVALRALAAEPSKDGRPLVERSGRLEGCEHIRLHPLTFESLAIVSDHRDEGGAGGPGGAPDTRSVELWVGLAQAAMANEDEGLPAVQAEPGDVADAIDRHRGDDAYDQVVVGYLLQIADQLKDTSSGEVERLRRRTGRLIKALRPETLRRLVEMGGDLRQRTSFVQDSTRGMATEAVLDIVRAAADAGGQTISHGMMRMLSKLSVHAERGGAQTKSAADAALREQVHNLVDNWQITDPNPEDYSRMLQYLATAAPSATSTRDVEPAPGDLRLLQTALEVGGIGPMVDRAVRSCLASGQAREVLALLERVPRGGEAAAARIRECLVEPASITAVATGEPFDGETLDALQPFMTAESYGALLDVLASSKTRLTRRLLLDRLAASSIDLGPLIVARLADERWFVQRNMLLLLARLGTVPAGLSLAEWTAHPDARVRGEALRVQMELPGEGVHAMRMALQDDDPKIVRIGLLAMQAECPPSLLPLAARITQDEEAQEELRLMSIQSLGRVASPAALAALLPLVDGGRNLFGRRRLRPRSALVVAALRVLASRWRHDEQVAPFMELAATSSDDDVRASVR